MKIGLVLTALILVTSVLSAASPTKDTPAAKAAWQWTEEERIAVRLDPQRGRPAPPSVAPDSAAGTAADRPKVALSYTIDGRTNPELFLPHELFDSIAGGLSPDAKIRQKTRSFYREDLIAAGYDDNEFWAALETAASPYVALKRRAYLDHIRDTAAAKKSGSPWTPSDHSDDPSLCRARIDGLNAARQHFGRETFDKFLYNVVAPNKMLATSSNYPDPAELLRREAGGCR
jgi:hypothetical protein